MAKDKFYLGRTWNPVTGRTGRAVYFDLDEIPHMLLVGPPGSGKGATIEIVNLLGDNLRRCSVVSVDPSGQNKAVTARYRATFSDCVFLDPFGSEDTGCNPLLSVETLQDALGIAEALQDANNAHDPFFPEGSRGLIAGAVLAEVREAKQQDRTPTLENVRSILTGDLVAFAKEMVEHGGDFQIASLLRSFTLPENRTIEAIKKTAEVATRWLLVEPVRSSLSVKKGKGVDWAKLKGPRPLTVYVILDAEKLIMFAPWLKLVTVSALNTLYRLGNAKGLNTVFMMSEFYSLGKLTPVLSGLAQGRKYGVRFAPMVIQDISQLSEVYGNHGANSVIGNSGALLAFSPSPGDGETSEFVSRAAGEHSVISRSTSTDAAAGGGVRVNINETRERLWPPEKIRSIPKFHALAWKSGKVQPVYCPPYWTTKLARRADADPYHAGASGAAPGRKVTVRGVAASLLTVAAIIAGSWFLNAAPVVHGGASEPTKANPPAHHQQVTRR